MWAIGRMNVQRRGGVGEQLTLVLNRYPDPPDPKAKLTTSALNEFRDHWPERCLRKVLGESEELHNLRRLDKRLAEVENLNSEFETRIALEKNAAGRAQALEQLDGAELVAELTRLDLEKQGLGAKLSGYRAAQAELRAQRDEAARALDVIAHRAASAARHSAQSAAVDRMRAITKEMLNFSNDLLSEYCQLEEAVLHLDQVEQIRETAGRLAKELTALPAAA